MNNMKIRYYKDNKNKNIDKRISLCEVSKHMIEL